MGMFTWTCCKCQKSLLSPYACEQHHLPESLAEGVAILGDGRILSGTHDGYGAVGGQDLAEQEPQIFHRGCWEASGKPTAYTGPSPLAEDQGLWLDQAEFAAIG